MNPEFPLSIHDLNLSIGNTVLFKDLTFELRPHEFVSVMGENGTGKTCLLETICGVRKPSSGKVLFWGKPFSTYDSSELFSKVGWVTSTQETYPFQCTINELFHFLKTIYPYWNEKLATDLCQSFNMTLSKRLSDLSLGEHSKVKLIKAISFEPQLLLLDELTANLSPDSKSGVLKALIDVFSRTKMSILYVCHAKEEAVRLSDRIVHLDTKVLKERGSL